MADINDTTGDRIELQKDNRWAVWYQGEKQDMTHTSEGSAKNALHQLRMKARAEEAGETTKREPVRRRVQGTSTNPPPMTRVSRKDDDE